MLLFQKRFHEGLTSGAITLTFRRWDKPHVKVGGRYRCHPIGVLEVDRIERVRVSEITEDDAARAGFDSRDALVDYVRTARDAALDERSELYRIELHHGGDGDRVTLALEAEPTPEEIATIRAKLARMDEGGAWTARTLALIEKNPRVAASQLAKKLGRETLPFKVDVRKLKKLGLTQSFEVGYEISPRGRAYLAAKRPRRTR
ncbi:ASCH domain-containing protein [Sandaracinus amylolyticus]|uniref:ASCH domain-containing protein n=1 Tax=Sandaracinus amylolyticus TaxID=927083 RepID=UPI001F3FD858|nr:ASCH domain-containing protein [Sandaracinus amylolyticus]